MSTKKRFGEELAKRLKTPCDEYVDDLPSVEELMEEAQRKPIRVGSLDGIVPPPPEFFEPMSEEELRDWEGDETDNPLAERGLDDAETLKQKARVAGEILDALSNLQNGRLQDYSLDQLVAIREAIWRNAP